MILHGQPLHYSPATTTVVLPRPQGETLLLQLRPLPLGFHRRLRERGLVPPTPPTRVARDAQGRTQRDSQGLAATICDPHDPQYLCELERYHHRVAVLSVADALTADPHLAFESPLPAEHAPPSAWQHYADQLASEMEQAGFTAGDLLKLCDAICRLSNLLEDHVGAQTANFSSALPRTPT